MPEGTRLVEQVESDPDARIVERAEDIARLGLQREGRRRQGALPLSRIGELGYAAFQKTITLRGGRTQEITFVSRGVDPVVGPSVAEGMNWILDTPEFQGPDGEPETPTDEERGVQVGNIWSYALDAGMSTGQVERRMRQAEEV
ncbi:MAG TPA: hypothetical protein VLA88_00545 [Candidatus Saccharimonadales bacterium]|nr:hypothetical protein [Candidatus Saccharimonadales bacterium]